MFKPVGHRVLIKPDDFEEITEGGIIINVGNEWKREKAATVIGTVIDIGPTAWKDFKIDDPWCAIGDKVYYAKYSGKTIIDNDIEYVVVNDEDIICLINQGVADE